MHKTREREERLYFEVRNLFSEAHKDKMRRIFYEGSTFKSILRSMPTTT